MEACVKALDDYFCATYCDYSKIGAIKGYKMPDLIEVGKGGTIVRKDNSLMLLNRQEHPEELLKEFKKGLEDTDYSFSFSCVNLFRRFRNKLQKDTFCKTLERMLVKYKEDARSVGELLDIDGKIWDGIVKGRLYPEKNTILAIALVCRMTLRDLTELLYARDFELSNENVRDVVVEFLITQKIFNEGMMAQCLAEYKISCLPIRSLQMQEEKEPFGEM